MIMTARDFSFCSNSIPLKNGDHCLINYSIEHDKIPEVNKIIRGQLNGMFILKRVEDDVTELKNVLSLDFKGSLPGFTQSKATEKQFENMKNLREIMES
jgi:hypothetical protein